MLRDLYLAFRALRKELAFTLMAVVLLGLGIGSVTAMFGLIDVLLVHALPFRSADRMVALHTHWTGAMTGTGPLSYPDFQDLKAQARAFEKLAVYRTDDFTLQEENEAFHTRGAVVSANILRLLGVSPSLGRGFSEEEENVNGSASAPPLLLSYTLWQDRFSGGHDVLGKTVVLDGMPFVVAGVMPEKFAFPLFNHIDLWVPMVFDLKAAGSSGLTVQRAGHYLEAIGLLNPGIPLNAAQTDVNLVMSRLAQQYPDTNRDKGILLEPEEDAVIGDRRSQLLMLSVGVLCIFLIACINVATLMLARAARKEKETAVYLALGASFGRVLRQILAQCIWLVLFGALAGIALAGILVRSFAAWEGAGLDVHINPEVLLFLTAAACVSVLLCGCGPAVLIARQNDLAMRLKAARSSTGGKRTKYLRHSFIIGQTALAMILMVQAGLLLRSIVALGHVDMGFNPKNVLTFQLQFPPGKYNDTDRNLTLKRVVENLRTLPGVSEVAITRSLPLSGEDMAAGFRVPGIEANNKRLPVADLMLVGSGYFDALGIRVLSGRAITAQDERPDARPVAIINETTAKRAFGNENPIGHNIQPLVRLGDDPPALREIVGVVRDVKNRGLNSRSGNQIYVPYTQLSLETASIALRASADVAGMSDEIRARVRQTDPTLPAYNMGLMEHYIALSTAQLRYNTTMLMIFGIVGLALTTVGLYSVIAYSVAQRWREFGIRMALGAQGKRILLIVLKDGAMLTLISITFGMVGALVTSRLLASVLFGVTPYDPLTFGIVIALIVLVALIATYAPARRTLNLDVVDTLRAD